jgi:DNA-binding transcriptional ArsR family regulator
MSGSEEETYSLMFSSLRHPARRKILRMLSERTMTFSQMLEELAIPSSHLTYHLENLGELVVKEKEGKYKLSSFGNAAVSMMKGAEEVPNASTKRFMSLPLKWKSLYAAFIIGLVLLASFSVLQYSAINQLSTDYGNLKNNYDNVSAQNDKLLHWTPSGSLASTIINNVIQIDVTQYQVTFTPGNAFIRQDMGGIVEEDFNYLLVNSQSKFELSLVFRDSHFEQFQLIQIEGAPNFPPIYKQTPPSNPLQATKALIDRYQSVVNDSYINQAAQLLASATNTASDQTLGNTKLKLVSYGSTAEAHIIYTENGTDFTFKSMTVALSNNIITKFTDDWFLFKAGNAQINISKDQAILAVKEAAKTFSWNANGIQVSGFQVLDNPVQAELTFHNKGSDTLTLYPYWIVTLQLDKTYPGGINSIQAGVWTDTGKVENMQAK